MTEQELDTEMGKIYEAQQKCLRIQEILVALTFPFYLFGIIAVVLNFLVAVTWGIYLVNKASSLAIKKYPHLGYRRCGNGISWDPPIIDEAKKCHDTLTVRILRFNYWSLGLVAASMLVYIFMLTWGSRFLIWQINFFLTH